MFDTDEQKEQVARKFDAAFADVPYPGDDQITLYPNTSIASRLVKLFTGKHWRDIPLDAIIEERDGLVLFTPQAFRFYLPAFVRAALRHGEETDTLWENIFFNFTPPDRPSAMEDFLARVNTFTTEQIAAIWSYVQLYVQIETSYPDPNRAKAVSFWEKRLTATS